MSNRKKDNGDNKVKIWKKLIIYSIITLSIIDTIIVVIYFINENKCPGDYRWNKDRCEKIITQIPKKIRYCDDGYKIENGKCTKQFTYEAKWNATCPNDFDLVDIVCQKKIYLDD